MREGRPPQSREQLELRLLGCTSAQAAGSAQLAAQSSVGPRTSPSSLYRKVATAVHARQGSLLSVTAEHAIDALSGLQLTPVASIELWPNAHARP